MAKTFVLGLVNLPLRPEGAITQPLTHFFGHATQWPNETAICPFVRRRIFGAQKRPNIRLRPNVRPFAEYSAILTNVRPFYRIYGQLSTTEEKLLSKSINFKANLGYIFGKMAECSVKWQALQHMNCSPAF